MVAQLRVEVTQDPQKTVFQVWTQEMVVEAQPKYDERFANGLGLFSLLVVKRTRLVCRYKVAVGCVSAAASSS